MYMMTNYFNYK